MYTPLPFPIDSLHPVDWLFAALSFAAERHRDQRRKGALHAPYINHLIEVAHLLWSVGGVRDPEVLAAAVLHDVLEDTPTSPKEINRLFGVRVRALVQEVSDDKSLPQAERKRLQEEHAPCLTADAKLIKLADKISNVRSILEDPPEQWSDARRREYVAWAVRVVAGMRGVNPALEDEFDRMLARAREIWQDLP